MKSLLEKALVIGGTGIIGNHVIRELLNQNIQVRTLSRGKTPSENLKGLEVERVSADLEDTKALTQAMQGCRFVFHTAPYYPTNAFHPKKHLQKAATGLESVLAACRQSKIERLVYTSSLTTVGPNASGMADETDLIEYSEKSPHPYFYLKSWMENRVRQSVQTGEVNAVIVLPTGCFGPYEAKPDSLCLIPQLLKGQVPFLLPGLINAVDVADVAKGQVAAAFLGRTGERYILGGHNTTAEEVVRGICRVAKVKAPKFKLPLSVAIGAAWLAEFWGYYIANSISAIPLLGLRFIEYGQHLSSAKALRELKYTISPLDPCFERAIEWFKNRAPI